MKVQSNVKPDTVWVRFVENGVATARLRNNIASSAQTTNGTTQTIYTYDEIEFQVVNRDNLAAYITDNATFYWAQALDDAKVAQRAILATARDTALAQGVTSSADGTSRVYPSDSHMLTLLHQEATDYTLGLLTFPINWPDATGTMRSLTEVQFKVLLRDFSTAKHATYAKYNGLVGQVMVATTIAEVQAIRW